MRFPESFYLYAVAQHGSDAGARLGLEFLAGYVVEKSLAIDNIFVFVLVFSYFSIPAPYQHRVLFYGILGALIFRAIFIALGSVLLQYHAIVVAFGVLLLLTGVKMLLAPARPVDFARNPVMRLLQRLLPLSQQLHGQSFIVRVDGRRHATPLLVALMFVELSDVVFAVDSVPAIFALTSEPLIVYTSNVFAILGLRSMYFMLVDAVDRFHLLKYSLALILVFVGTKMVWLNDWFGGKFPIAWSLGIIGTIVALGIAASLLRPRRGWAPVRQENAG